MDSDRLTKDEKWAIAQAILAYDLNDEDKDCATIAATLRGLLERMGDGCS